MLSEMFSGFKAWYAEPYQSDMSATKWFLFFGLILLILAVWKIIVWHLMEAA